METLYLDKITIQTVDRKQEIRLEWPYMNLIYTSLRMPVRLMDWLAVCNSFICRKYKTCILSMIACFT